MGEKYDGVRCCWNPMQRRLYPSIKTYQSMRILVDIGIYSRYGKLLDLPFDFRSQFPKAFVDGEIWYCSSSFSLSFVCVC